MPNNINADNKHDLQPQISSQKKKLEQRGCQPKPDSNFGYQPVNKSAKPLPTPKTGSKAVEPKSK